MSIEIHDLRDRPWAAFDTIIDVRAPSEFAEDHLPGAINLPVLSDEERAKVGTIYTQESPFLARKLGAALVSRNVAHHLETTLRDMEGGWQPLVYCWRGGQRSKSFATILDQVGWRVQTIAGGYRSYRRRVVEALYDNSLPHRILRIDGNTGTAKTELLIRLARRGAQVIDLEGLARHRGSALGPRPGGQPSQKWFETELAAALSGFDPERPVLVEAESSKIGDLAIPPSLWKRMAGSPRLVVEAAPEVRARYLARAYADLTDDLPALIARLDALRSLQGHETVSTWQEMAHDGQFTDLARALIEAHYDRAYARARNRQEAGPVLGRIGAKSLENADLDRMASDILARLDDPDTHRSLGDHPDARGGDARLVQE